MIQAMNDTRVLNAIKEERLRQNKKFGEQNHDDYHWLAVLTEEVGELAQAILHDEFGDKAAGTAPAELIQVAAVAVQWLECIQRRKASDASQEAACHWSYGSKFDEFDNVWESDCGEQWEFIDGDPGENGMKFCHNCGRLLVVETAVSQETP